MTAHAIARPGIPRLTAVELRKSADTRAGFWLLVAIALLAAGLATLQLVFGEPSEQHLAPVFRTTIEGIAIILPVLGILLVTSEWSQRTGLTTFALVPQRERVIVAKAIGATVLTAFAVAACVVVSAFGTAIAGGDWELGLGALGRAGLYELIGMLGGVAFGLLFLNSALAIVLYYVIPIGWAILGESISALDGPADWLDLSRTMLPLLEGGMTGGDWARLGTSVALWVGLLLALGLLRLRRVELK